MIIKHSSNFREIVMGKIAPGVLYRSNHPISNGKQVQEIISAANNVDVKTIINLSDDFYSLQSKIMYCPWYKKSFEENNVIALNMDRNYDIMGSKTRQKIREAITFMSERVPPYLIHCEAGTDRIGFLTILLEAFMEAEFDDMVKDYMLSFVSKKTLSVSDYIHGHRFLHSMFAEIKGAPINSNDNLHLLTEKYLRHKTGINQDVLMILKSKLMGMV